MKIQMFTRTRVLFTPSHLSPYNPRVPSGYEPSKLNYLVSALAGLAYGCILRFGVQHHWPVPKVMSVGFVFFVPFAMGYIAVTIAERKAPHSFFLWFFLPWIIVSVGLVGSMIALWEGFICVIMFAPIAWLCGSAGGVLAGFVERQRSRRAVRNVPMMLVVALPFLVNPVAQKFFYNYQVRTVATQVDIQAPIGVVWRNIERVPAIETSELKPAWSQRVGFPAPDQATLSYEGVGAVRHATFQGGVLFTETVDTWEPDHRLAFSIHAETERIPNTTLDEHVRVGGPYFDVLHGDYELEQLPNGIVRLHLSSRHRVSTDFNWYAQLWTDAIMRDIQNSILYVIKNRCEGKR